jgi:type III pantothenate kinase
LDLLVVDIGNSSIHLGIIADGTLVSRWDGRHRDRGLSAVELSLRDWLSTQAGIDAAVIGSVVPDFVGPTTALTRELCGVTTDVLNRDCKLPFANLYAHGHAGIDRLANVAAVCEKGLVPCVIVDAGTAITVELVTGAKEFSGGVIFPGPEAASRSLAGRTALLPEVNATDDYRPHIQSLETNDAIMSGGLLGCAGAIDRFVAEGRTVLGQQATAILTGGMAERFSMLCEGPFLLEKNLTLLGLGHLWEHNFGT